MGGDWPNLHVAWNSWGVTVLQLRDAMGCHGDSLIPCQLHQAAPDTVNRRTGGIILAATQYVAATFLPHNIFLRETATWHLFGA